MTRRIALITTLLALAIAAPASAQSGAFGPLPAAAPTETPAVTTTTTDSGDTSSSVLFIIGGALIVGFGVMGWFIFRDARSAAPRIVAASPEVLDGPANPGARKPHTQAAKKKMRDKNRRQRQARKAHRR